MKRRGRRVNRTEEGGGKGVRKKGHWEGGDEKKLNKRKSEGKVKMI